MNFIVALKIELIQVTWFNSRF